ncbi:DUF4177 domain-containing protein [Luteimonas composti]|uniref:DUF4177 domain-containing protein n=1 Tax=Luteimonas composti TaxID=398257 RepID=A0ABT6MX15_9GAMM|nr:DUF4177 domain-containing protein [Luteimonas composti]MDH7454691.1 DUF4177 domain-containing protein [Luteimonas composti]
MSQRWEHKVVEITTTLFNRKLTEKIQEELDRHSRQGWELVAVSHTNAVDSVRLYLKKAV